MELNGVPAMVAEDVIPERGASALFVTEVPGNDELTLGVFLGIDTSTGTEVDAVVVVEAMAELGLARLLGNAD